MESEAARGYCTLILPALLVSLSMVTVSGYVPAARPAGTTRLTWTRPTQPGASPAKLTGPGAEPIVALCCAVAKTSESSGAAIPSVAAGLTGPDPVWYAMMVLPGAAGLPG